MKSTVSLYLDVKYKEIAASQNMTLNELVDLSLSVVTPLFQEETAPVEKETPIRLKGKTLTLLKKLKGSLSYDRFIYLHFSQYVTKPLTLKEKLIKWFPRGVIKEDETNYYITQVDRPVGVALLASENIQGWDDPSGYIVVPKEV